MRPIGVVSKKDTGDLTTPRKAPLKRFKLALKQANLDFIVSIIIILRVHPLTQGTYPNEKLSPKVKTACATPFPRKKRVVSLQRGGLGRKTYRGHHRQPCTAPGGNHESFHLSKTQGTMRSQLCVEHRTVKWLSREEKCKTHQKRPELEPATQKCKVPNTSLQPISCSSCRHSK